ncbi:MFS transporter [Alicyclobacillus dauci]|uniref:MFS transporter n=1 Tax=Alicyclobacillus dauci TaxID=1475485 RepID=A0ABY6Z3D7_9BACL|nr:MFS transporter [Alicyclobacillus dauci]WAH36716.1 MFS transporter [Alicyclobacillus dauci]
MEKYPSRSVQLLAIAGLGKNVGFGVNKVFVAAVLQSLSLSASIIGIVLALEGLFGLILHPTMGYLSDHTRTRGFRRKVYVLVCLPGAALCWFLFFAYNGQASVQIFLIALFYVFQQASESPYKAWMGDIVPKPYWGRASSHLNIWWEIGNLIAFLIIPLIWTTSHIASIILTCILITGSGLWTGLTVPESVVLPTSGHRSRAAYRTLVKRPFLFFYLSQGFAWLAFESIASFFTLLVVHTAHGTVFDSAIGMSIFTVTGIIGAILTGRVYHRVGPRTLMGVSIFLFGLVSLSAFAIHSVDSIFALVAIEGVFWGTSLTASFAYVGDLLHAMTHDDETEGQVRGTVYGVYNIMQAIGLLIAGPIGGAVITLTGGKNEMVTILTLLAGILGAVCTLFIQTRETPADTSVSVN